MFQEAKIERLLKSLIFIGLLALVVIIFSQQIKFTSSDLGRHLENGRIVWQDRQVLFTNFYSYTEPDQLFVNHHWLSGVIFYAVYLLGGFKLLSVFNILLILAAFSLAFNLARRKAGFYVASLLSIPAIFLLSERVEVRPEIVSYLFIILSLVIIDSAATSKRYGRLWWLVILSAVWVNIHIYFFIGLALIGFKAAAEFLPPFSRPAGGLKDRLAAGWLAAKPWIKTFIYASLAGLLNPNTWRGLLYPFNIFQNYGYEIAENKSIFYLGSLMINHNFAVFKFLLLLLILSFLLYYLVIKKLNLFELFLALFFSSLAFFASRNLSLFALTALILISVNLAALRNYLQAERPSLALLWRRSLWPYGAGLSLALILLALPYLLTDYARQGSFIKNAPGWGLAAGSTDSIEFFRERGLSGPVFNNYDLGSALIFWLYPDERVFVDNRPEAYRYDFFTEIYKPLQSDPAKWRAFSDIYKFKTVYFAYTDSTPWAQDFLRFILADQDWALIYFDRATVILVNKKLTTADIIKESSLDVWAFRARLRELAAQSDQQAKFQLGYLAQAAQQPDLAAEIYQGMLFANPDNRQVLVSFGYLYAAQADAGSLNRSLDYLRRALELGYELPGLYDQMGLIEWQRGAYQKAEAYWRSALKLDRKDAAARYYLDQIKSLQSQGKLSLPE
ncbi:MAG: hypothetical protein WC456_03130 [Patescibacteria group bacterium]